MACPHNFHRLMISFRWGGVVWEFHARVPSDPAQPGSGGLLFLLNMNGPFERSTLCVPIAETAALSKARKMSVAMDSALGVPVLQRPDTGSPVEMPAVDWQRLKQ